MGANLFEADKVDKDPLLEIAMVGVDCLQIKVTALSIWVNLILGIWGISSYTTQCLCLAQHDTMRFS